MGKISHVTMRVTRKEKEPIRAAAKLAGMSMTRFVIAASEQKAAWVLDGNDAQVSKTYPVHHSD
jgi:uncharacterized protein (DUF1778 family)